LSVEEKFKLIPYLAASHTEDLIGYHLLLNFLNLQVCSGGHRFYNWLILGKLHPKTLESIWVQVWLSCKVNRCKRSLLRWSKHT
jgi:hypothetical protein